ncbi:hypothetical protein Pmar_PMAR021001, partial [Perkinsus marinus ATCC 50983]
FTKPFIVQADGSSHGLGAALCQVDDNGVERPIKFAKFVELCHRPKVSGLQSR